MAFYPQGFPPFKDFVAAPNFELSFFGRKAANRTGTPETEPKSPKPNGLRFTKKLEKPETGETETAVYKKWYL